MHQVQEYLEGLLPEEILSIQERSRIVSELPEQTPVGPTVAQLVSILILATRPKRVLEIGTATGYSAIAIGKALKHVGGTLTTIEIDERSASIARENIKNAGLQDVIQVIVADANETLRGLNASFGLILQDGTKDDYLQMLPILIKLLAPHGLLITDDVLFPVLEVPVEERPYQYALTLYNAALQDHPDLQTVWLPVGNGVAISTKISL